MNLSVGPLLAAIAVAVVPASINASNQVSLQPGPSLATVTTAEVKSAEPVAKVEDLSNKQPPKSDARSSFRAAVREIVEQEVRDTGLPADIADAVVYVESSYDPSVVGGVGEIGLMQVRPETAAMLGFRGSAEELTRPETNIHYGVIYLSKAWRLASGDLCRALMKYRAGHGEEIMSPLSVEYCRRARNYLATLGSPFGIGGSAIVPASVSSTGNNSAKPVPNSPKEVYASNRQGTASASRAFWAAHEARVRAIKARIESKWRRVASR